MSEAGKQLIEGVAEMLAIAKGEQPAARVTIKGHAYVPEARATALAEEVERLREALAWTFPYADAYKPKCLSPAAQVQFDIARALLTQADGGAADA